MRSACQTFQPPSMAPLRHVRPASLEYQAIPSEGSSPKATTVLPRAATETRLYVRGVRSAASQSTPLVEVQTPPPRSEPSPASPKEPTTTSVSPATATSFQRSCSEPKLMPDVICSQAAPSVERQTWLP